jgi:chemotaxis protein MotA
MDLATVVGLAVGLVVLVVVMIMDGGSPLELFAQPQAILLIIGGSIAATVISSPLETAKNLPKFFMQAFIAHKFDVAASIDLLVKMADRARRDGLLALEEETKNIDDKFLKDGLMMVVDGIDQAQIRAILETNIEQMHTRHRAGINFFAGAGGFAPTFGIIGTVMGLINVLKQLDNPGTLAKAIAGAFLATLWGLLMANLIYLPLAGKLKVKNEEEAHVRYMQLEGILSIHAGENPQIVREKLKSYLPPSEANKEAGEGEAAGGKESKAPQKARA